MAVNFPSIKSVSSRNCAVFYICSNWILFIGNFIKDLWESLHLFVELLVWSQHLAVFLILGDNFCLLKNYISTFMPLTIQYNLVSDILCFQCPSSKLDCWDGRDTGRHNWGCIYCVSVLSFLCFLIATWESFDGKKIWRP